MNQTLLWHRLCLNSTLLLLLTLVTDLLVLRGNAIAAVIYSLPLVLLFYALLRKQIRMLQWLGFVLMLYFLYSVVAVFSPGRMYTGIIASVLCVLAFISAMLFINKSKTATSTALNPAIKESTQ